MGKYRTSRSLDDPFERESIGNAGDILTVAFPALQAVFTLTLGGIRGRELTDKAWASIAEDVVDHSSCWVILPQLEPIYGYAGSRGALYRVERVVMHLV
jgi:hypothetical protein